MGTELTGGPPPLTQVLGELPALLSRHHALVLHVTFVPHQQHLRVVHEYVLIWVDLFDEEAQLR